MYPEDRVLIVYVPHPDDFACIENEGWYRIPQQHAPKGLYAEYFAFYFGRRFGANKWAIPAYAPRLGHELVTRRELLPCQPDHPRADALYYKVQLGAVQWLARPIISLRWRRVTFLHTTWDRFQDAAEINDLFVDGEGYVDRLYAALKEAGIQPERNYRVEEAGQVYEVPLAVPCRHGRIHITSDQLPRTAAEIDEIVADMARQTAVYGGTITK